MKQAILILQTSFLLLITAVATAQVKDIGQTIKKTKGYVENVDYKLKVMLVNLIKDHEIVREVVLIKNTQFTNSHKDSLSFTDIKNNDEILLEAEQFNVDKYSEATKITLLEKSVKSIKDGRIDYIRDDIAYVDGNRIKLAPEKKIKGQKKTGYETKSFDKVTELKLHDFASLKGKYDPAKYYLADEFTITPNNVTDFDKKADTVDRKYYQKFYPAWNDKNKRQKFFNTDVPGIGKITNDPALQEYVNSVGMKLVPKEFNIKTGFIFIVVDNPALNANMRANGLCYIYTGLLKVLENEAQLATILGHEIAHVIYEHVSTSLMDSEKAAKNKSKVSDGGKAGKNILKDNKLFKGKKDKDQTDSANALVEKNADDLAELIQNGIDRRISVYNVNEESQADRVGLFIMALAGYDPRQAAIVWKNIYNRYGVPGPVNTGLATKTRQEATKDKSNDKDGKEKKKSNFTNSTLQILNVLIKWKAADYKSKSYKTHPDHLKRFEELNKLISLYWNDDAMLNNSMLEEDAYLDKIKKLKK